ncbi:MAG: InlB B-repeat-containing protein, partial [Actinobacteria bacterium]|nr:InlB B-repeat-containing protein [Actinomycetota bacterium]
MILEILRRTYATLRKSLPTSISWVLVLSLFVAIPSQVALSSTANAAACSPTTTTSGEYTVVTFSTVGSCDWTAPTYSSNVLLEVLMVGGGGGAGFGSNGGGGGAGQVLMTKAPLSVSSGSSISVKVGAGGAGGYQSSTLWTNGTNGETSTITIASNSYNAIGGGSGGGDVRLTGASGGSGGGGALSNRSGSAITNSYSAFYSYGYSSTQGSGTSAGGAGAGGTNSNRTGGTGVTLWGLSIGGGGAGWASGTGATAFGGGSAGSGTGAGTSHGNPGIDGTGGGGGGGEKGGSGLVVIRYKTSGATCSPTQSTVDTYTVLTFSTVSICNWTVPTGVSSIEALVVGGGGAGSKGISNYYWPAGGGGGAVVTNSSVTTTPGDQLQVNVGAGGIGPGVTGTSGYSEENDGDYSSFGTVIAAGGKTPKNILADNAGAYGGSSGNGNAGGFGGTNGSGCGSASCGAGGGGGAGGAGNVLAGGAGVTSNISGSSVLYGAGGAGHNGGSGTAPSGAATQSVDAAANRGGGGAYGKAGGTGVVIIRYGLSAGYSYLTFNANSGTGTKAPGIAANGSAISAPNESGFSLTGFDFNGWNTAANGTGTSYSPGASITLNSSTTLYAQWIRIPSPTCAAGVGKGGPVTSTIALTKA